MTVTGISAVWLKRGTIEKKHAHAADIVAIVSVQVDADKFKTDFQQQFQADAELGLRVLKILGTYFRETTSPGLLVYEEFIVADKPLDRNARLEFSLEIERAHKLMMKLLPFKSIETRSIRKR